MQNNVGGKKSLIIQLKIGDNLAKSCARHKTGYLFMKKLLFILTLLLLSVTSYSQYTQYKCNSCNGYGKLRCSNCSGRGWVVVSMMDPYTGYFHNVKTTCAGCSGYGVVYCAMCRGKGVIVAAQPSFGSGHETCRSRGCRCHNTRTAIESAGLNYCPGCPHSVKFHHD